MRSDRPAVESRLTCHMTPSGGNTASVAIKACVTPQQRILRSASEQSVGRKGAVSADRFWPWGLGRSSKDRWIRIPHLGYRRMFGRYAFSQSMDLVSADTATRPKSMICVSGQTATGRAIRLGLSPTSKGRRRPVDPPISTARFRRPWRSIGNRRSSNRSGSNRPGFRLSEAMKVTTSRSLFTAFSC